MSDRTLRGFVHDCQRFDAEAPKPCHIRIRAGKSRSTATVYKGGIDLQDRTVTEITREIEAIYEGIVGERSWVELMMTGATTASDTWPVPQAARSDLDESPTDAATRNLAHVVERMARDANNRAEKAHQRIIEMADQWIESERGRVQAELEHKDTEVAATLALEGRETEMERMMGMLFNSPALQLAVAAMFGGKIPGMLKGKKPKQIAQKDSQNGNQKPAQLTGAGDATSESADAPEGQPGASSEESDDGRYDEIMVDADGADAGEIADAGIGLILAAYETDPEVLTQERVHRLVPLWGAIQQVLMTGASGTAGDS